MPGVSPALGYMGPVFPVQGWMCVVDTVEPIPASPAESESGLRCLIKSPDRIWRNRAVRK